MIRPLGLLATCTLFTVSSAVAHTRHPHLHPRVGVDAIRAASVRAAPGPIAITIDTDPAHALNRFLPETAFGAGVDGVPYPSVHQIYTPANVSKLLGAGLSSLSYRLYTELSVQDWHWNPAGTFSAGAQGYWTSTPTPAAKTVDTFGYRLPRRGNTTDQGNSDDYSRLDDGHPESFWKSNPYLTRAYTHEADTLHPQWAMVDLGRARRIDTAHIAWAAPFARAYRVQFWTGADAVNSPDQGDWRDFPGGIVTTGVGGVESLALGEAGRSVRYVRVLMSASSGTCTGAGAGSGTDPRDCMGYAIAELGLGTTTAGVFHDALAHRADNTQTATYVSSTDPWHRATDRVLDEEQPGLDTVLQSGLTRGLPITVPVPMLFSTPENAVAEIAYLKARGAKIARIELGEEPDGQYILPEDYAALYTQWADALHALDPKLILGGPIFQGTLNDVAVWSDASGNTSWTKRFLSALAAHGHSADLGFFAIEHYPFSGCALAERQANLLQEAGLMAGAVQAFRVAGVPATVPIFVTEANYSAGDPETAMRIDGAPWMADFYGGLLSAGAAGAFFYEYEPVPLTQTGQCWGTYGLNLGDANYHAGAPLSQYAAAKLMTQHWTRRGAGVHTLYLAKSASALVGAYPLQRPDGSWAVLLVNRDLEAAHEITLRFGNASFQGRVTGHVFSAFQYAWVKAGARSQPSPDLPVAAFSAEGGPDTRYALPKASVTVLEGNIQPGKH